MASSSKSLLEKPDHDEEAATATGSSSTVAEAEEEDTGAAVTPIIKLQEVAVATGEENEDVLLDLKAKLYRFDREGNQWKERGAGNVKLLKHIETNKVRLVMRQSKTLKICANHLVVPSISLQEHAGSDKSCVWHAADYADGVLKEELFSIRFASVENCNTFKEVVEVARSQDVAAAAATEENEDANATANLLENLSVKENKGDYKEPKETSSTVEADEKNEAGPSS